MQIFTFGLTAEKISTPKTGAADCLLIKTLYLFKDTYIMNLLLKIENIAKDIFFEYGYVEIKNLKFYEEVRTLCKKIPVGITEHRGLAHRQSVHFRNVKKEFINLTRC